MMVFFENDHCVKCNEPLGFSPERLEMAVVKNLQTSNPNGATQHTCANRDQHHVCNWMVPDADNSAFCLACRLNDLIPDLTVEGNLARWSRLELAKRQCLYSLLRLGLPVEQGEDPKAAPLRFRFLADTPSGPALTGHDGGIITINIAEADPHERERRRGALHEPYRTLVGHFRHETGHYYWDRIIADSPYLQGFRELFGDETASYDESLKRYYDQGPSKDWQEHSVSAYSSLHPWEDWAETWAHYLHIMDTMETAVSFGIGLNTGKRIHAVSNPFPADLATNPVDFDKLLNTWMPFTLALNSVNRSMGLPDLYPFVISPKAIEKLRFIHETILSAARENREATAGQLAVK